MVLLTGLYGKYRPRFSSRRFSHRSDSICLVFCNKLASSRELDKDVSAAPEQRH